MIDKFEWVKLIFATIAAVAILCFTVIGVQTIWTEYVVKDYDRHLTGQVYVDAAVNQNVNLVFYKRGCPYCEVGKKAVINAAGKNQFPTFYIDVESEDGQDLVKKYQVKKAATIVQIRGGRSKRVTYAVKDRYGHYQPKRQVIKEVFND
ncbi:thioredoxin/glutaredoxin [Streptococcus pyogenes]|uniref:Thioredoxin/glutaredoxin n=1 Tax=Streptococcus pyogenes TaxID=1314 RepID=A0A8B6IY69_STRPY|nr:thioredoxin [Streptococcus pyogenes]VGU82805.1 thioredoxin/glutaredoxin [Streptococcus pyogenes]VGV16805.1 thioredoxin/glutaredoxin [Streptococcus pyogenes]VGV98725.1 thioredoxin/glutaredoxin [Streptococcus pyogenes]VHC58699.1 thioredoxin/glutaredoxin [Streptococcus pyogenes]VHC64648.1 thioredoxin/glutaredoxin [Streptococcus pyogenes]